MNTIDFNNMTPIQWIEFIKLVIIVPVFLFWSLYDLLTKTVRVKWQRTLIGVGIIYNFIYLFAGISHVNDNLTGFILCYAITYLYGFIKRLLKIGDFGKGDVVFCAIIGLLFGTAVGVLTIVLSFVLFDGILRLVRKIFSNLGHVEVAFFPFITAALFIIIFGIGEENVRAGYDYIFKLIGISGYLKIF